MKTCSCCKFEKSLSEFHANKSTASGFQSECKSCRKKRAADWHIANKDTASKRNKSYRERKPEVVKAASRTWYLANRDRKLAYLKKPEFAERRNQYSKDKRKELSDFYLRDLLGAQVCASVPTQLLEAKRLHLQIVRKLKELKA